MKVPIRILIVTNLIDPIKKYLKTLGDDYTIYFSKQLRIKIIKSVYKENNINLVLIDYTTIKNIPSQLKILTAGYPTIPFIVIGQFIPAKKIANLLRAGAKAGISKKELECLPILIEREVTTARQLKKMRKSVQLLKQKNALFDNLYNSIDEAILVYDYNEIKQVNRSFLGQLGYEDSQELLERNFFKTIVSSEDIASITAMETPSTSESKLVVPKVQLLKKDGSILLIDLQIQSVLIEGKWFAQILLDPILNKQSKEQTYIAEKKYNNLLIKHVEQVPGIIYQFQMFEDGTYCFPYVSNRVYDLYGISPHKLMEDGSKFLHYLHKDDVLLFLESGYLSKATMEEWRLEYRIDLPNYGIRWMRGTSNPVSMPDGSILWYGYVVDITKEKNASAALRDSEEQIRTMFTYAPDGILLADIEGRITKWNPKATAIFGWTAEEALGKKIFKLIGSERNHEHYQANVFY